MSKILIIEDEPDLVTVVKLRLEANGFEVLTAEDGEAGLRKIYEEKPDLILLDILMPKMDGYEVCRRLKNDPITAALPIVVITASGLKDVEEKSYQSGADFVMRKPFEASELLAKIDHYLGGRR
jgi:CheY-like chemotaxis protein